MGSWANGNRTIAVDLWGQQARGTGPNGRTMFHRTPRPVVGPRDLRQLFLVAYRAFADHCRAIDEPGVAVVAVHEASGRPQGIVRLAARVERHVAAIIGRHDAADLFLNASDDLALRHLAIILDPVKSWRVGDASVRYRVLDLRTTDGFLDEHGKTLRGLRCEGPALVRCGGHALFVLPLGDPSDWPADPEDAWECLPERIYFDEYEHMADGSLMNVRAAPAKRSRTSMMMRTQGPHETQSGIVCARDAAGVLELAGPRLSGQIRIGHEELRHGVLLGRYARCDSAALVDDPSLSRVHALLIQIDDRLVIVDTASINGTRLVGEHRSRLIELRGETELRLGKHTHAIWRFVS